MKEFKIDYHELSFSEHLDFYTIVSYSYLEFIRKSI